MELEFFAVYRTRFHGSSIVMITGVFSYDVDGTCYTGTDLITGENHFYYSYELWNRKLDEDEYLADITCSIENKEWYLASK